MELPPNKKSKKVVTPELAAALDRTKISERNANFVIDETLKSIDLSPDEVALSRQTVCRKRMEFRQSFACNLK